MPDFEIERSLKDKGFSAICGVDEAGRGPLCGSVVAAACILPEDVELPGLNDSKKLTPKKREALFDLICERAIAFGIAEGTVEEINETNILETTLHTMRRAISMLKIPPDLALIDGNITRGFELSAKAVVHGDAISPSIAAASILAKVTRDRYMIALDEKYPEYGFARNKGYGTAEHIAAIKKHGPCPEHRLTFIKNFI